MTKSVPNAGSSVVTDIFERRLKGDLETCRNFINESGIHLHGCNELKMIRFEWYLSADETYATLFEIKSFTVLGPVKKDLDDVVTQFGAGIRKYASGFYRL